LSLRLPLVARKFSRGSRSHVALLQQYEFSDNHYPLARDRMPVLQSGEISSAWPNKLDPPVFFTISHIPVFAFQNPVKCFSWSPIDECL